MATRRAVQVGAWVAVTCGLFAVVAWSAAGQAPVSIQIVSELQIPVAPTPAQNVRWASDHSIYLTRGHDGVAEVALDGNLTQVRQVIPDRKTLGLRFASFERLAVSPDFLAVSSLASDFAFRPLAASPDGKFKITKLRLGAAYGFDLQGDRLLLLGDPRPGTEGPANGEVAWIGPLTDHPSRDLKPFLYDLAGPMAPGLANCLTLELGAARFQPDGSYLVVPGFQEGVHLFSASGQPLHTWKNAAVGLDAPDCAGISPRQESELRASYSARFDFLNRHRVLEDILRLPQGPGLLIREVEAGKVRWTVSLLQGDQIATYQVPITGDLPYDRLRGDVRGHQAVFLRVWHGFDRVDQFRPSHLYVAEIASAPEVIR